MYPKKLQYYFDLAAKVALGGEHQRNFLVGSVGLRHDGVLVSACNGAVYSTDSAEYRPIPSSHSEARISNKLTPGSIVYVVRVAKKNNGLTPIGTTAFVMSRPCDRCRNSLIARGVSKAFYTIDTVSYGCFDFRTMTDTQYTITHQKVKTVEPI